MGIIQEIENNILPQKKLFIKYEKMQQYRHLRLLYKKIKRQQECSNNSAKTYSKLHKAFNKAKATLSELIKIT